METKQSMPAKPRRNECVQIVNRQDYQFVIITVVDGSPRALELRMDRLVWVAVLLIASMVITSCGGTSQSVAPTKAASNITVQTSTPKSVVDQGESIQLAATISGTNSQLVTWSITEGSAGGTISAQGLYTAPAASGSFHIVATSQADTSKTSVVTIAVASVTVSISPSESSVQQNSTKQFTAGISGTVDHRIAWAVSEGASGGSIDGEGLYRAPATTGTFHVVATSVADPSKSAMATATVNQGFKITGSLNHARSMHTATLLKDGRVLITGGVGTDGSNLDSAEIYDPVIGSFSVTSGKMRLARTGHTATLLNDGRVLIAGGFLDSTVNTIYASAELFDPVTETFSAVGDLTAGRSDHTATLLADGRVLMVGGGIGSTQGTAEFYNPDTQAFVPSGAEPWAVDHAYGHSATRLANGKVLIAGGVDSSDFVLGFAEIFDPANGKFSNTTPVRRYYHTATLLKDARVLITGGSDGNFLMASAQLYDPANGTLSATGSLASKLWHATANLLGDGRVLIAGGKTPGDCGGTTDECGPTTALAEIYDPGTGTFLSSVNMNVSRAGHTATTLQDGRVLITGGVTPDGTTDSAELY
jgi:hypothetical protein